VSAETSVTVVGAGATGGYLAAQLAKAGGSVTLVARADSLRQIRSSGITLERPDGERETIRPQRVLAANEIEHRADATTAKTVPGDISGDRFYARWTRIWTH